MMRLEDITDEQVEEFKKMCNRPNALDMDCRRMILATNGDVIMAAKLIIERSINKEETK